MSDEIQTGASVRAKPRRRGAGSAVIATRALPLAAPIGAEAGQPMPTIQGLPLAPTLAALVELQKQRTFCIRSQSRCDRSCDAFIARYLGYHSDLPEAEGKAIYARAKAMRRAIEKGGRTVDDNREEIAPDADGEGRSNTDNQSAHAVCTPIILASHAARLTWDNLRAATEKRMRQLTRTLPVWSWADTVDGLGELGVAVIVGEAGGDLSKYETKERLWKRLGLAVIDGVRQRRLTDPVLAAAHGYNALRRAEIWTLADSMFRHQWCGDKDEDGNNPRKSGKPVAIEAHAVGPYGAIYAARKAHTETREWTLKHRDDDARRLMSKALIEDLWRQWTGRRPHVA